MGIEKLEDLKKAQVKVAEAMVAAGAAKGDLDQANDELIAATEAARLDPECAALLQAIAPKRGRRVKREG